MRDRFSTTAAFVTIAAVSTALAAGTGHAQPGGGMGATPIAVDLKKVPVGAWSAYQVSVGEQKGKAHWALVDRTSDHVTVEMAMEGGPTQMMGGKMTIQMTLAPDPTTAAKPVQKVVMQPEGKDPMIMPSEAPSPKFEKPDPKKLVGKETVKVPAGSFPTKHYRSSEDRGVVDMWLTETVSPLGMVKMTVTPKAGSPVPPVSLELSEQGKDAKSAITKAPKPFDPASLMGPGVHGMHPPAAPPPAAPAK